MSQTRTTQVDRTASLIDFGIGQPGFDLLPHEPLRQAAVDRFAEGDNEFLNYGYEQGDGRFRQALAGFLSARYGTAVAAEDLMVTAGASQALDLICTQFTQPGDTIFVEEPSYFLALRILAEDHRLNLVSLPTDEQGLIIDAVEAELARRRPVFLYTIPTYQNPTGRTLSQERRERLVALSREHDFLVVADEVYHLLSYGEAPPPPLASHAETGHVLSIGSFSKILAPGLRLGWIQAAPHWVQRFVRSGLVDSGGGLNHFTSNIVRVVLERGWQETYLGTLRTLYGGRVRLMAEVLMEVLGDSVRFAVPGGGYFFWLEFPEAVDTAKLLPAAHEQGVGFVPGARFSSQNGLHNFMRLSFAHYGQAVIESGLPRLGRVVSEGFQ